MVLASPRSGKTSYAPIPTDWPDPKLGDKEEVVEQQIEQSREWQHKVAEVVNGILDGRVNCTGDLTLEVNSLVTLVKDRRCGIGSVIVLMPTSETAGGEMGVWISGVGTQVAGVPTFTVNHGKDSRSDRTFRYIIMGTATRDASPTTGEGFLLLDDGSFLLLDDGSKLIVT